MKDLVPLLQSLVWPVFILVVLFVGRRFIGSILDAIRVRIESGDTFEAGTSGLKLTSTGTLVAQPPSPLALPTSSDVAAPSEAEIPTPPEGITAGLPKNAVRQNPGVYVVHKARRDKTLDQGAVEFYRLRIFLETDPTFDLNSVKRVVYHLHPSFQNPDRTVLDAETQFEIRTIAWGQFPLRAEVFLREGSEPLKLERYINF
jgi:hypothetical protein